MKQVIEVKSQNPYEPYSINDLIVVTCPSCSNKYEWMYPYTVSSLDGGEPDMNKKCLIRKSKPQEVCPPCQAQLRINKEL